MLRILRSPSVSLPIPLVFVFLAVAPPVAQEPVTEPTPATPAEDAEAANVIPPQIILKTQKAPVFPPAALAGRFTGTVTLRASVLKDGKVGDIKILECSHPNLGFEQASIDAVKQWRFEPALMDGEPIEYIRNFKLNFRHGGDGSGKNPYVSATSVDERSGAPMTGGRRNP